MLEVAPQVSVQHVLTVWEHARQHGFEAVHLSGDGAYPATPELRETLRGLPEQFGWPVKQFGKQPISNGELLVMLTGETQWKTVYPLFWNAPAPASGRSTLQAA